MWEYQTIQEFNDKGIGSNPGTISEYISQKNCTALFINVKCLQNSGTRPTAADIHSKIGTIEVQTSGKEGASSQIVFDADDLPPLLRYEKGFEQGVIGTSGNNRYMNYMYYLPLSPDPYNIDGKFGYNDAKLVIKYNDDPTSCDGFSLTVGALLHTEMPKYYVQMIQRRVDPISGSSLDIPLPVGAYFMGVHTYSSTGLWDTSIIYATTIDEVCMVVDNKETSPRRSEWVRLDQPPGYYLVDGTYTLPEQRYQFWDYGWKESSFIPIGINTKLRIKWKTSDQATIYPIIGNKYK